MASKSSSSSRPEYNGQRSRRFERNIKETLVRIEKSKIVAILRAKNLKRALARGEELVHLGCGALEVTTDSVGFETLLKRLVERVGDRCAVGVGTVTTPEHLKIAKRCGATFALSPVNPREWGFIKQCHDMGILAVPAAFSPQEIHEAVVEGAKCVKVFPAQLWTPSKFKSLRGIGEFGEMCLIPSGGITPETAQDWISSGASAVGMGSNLVGKDVRTPPDDVAALRRHEQNWSSEGRARAKKVFQRFNSSPRPLVRARL
eukprot:g3863.t1